jgi:hypothetical protein
VSSPSQRKNFGRLEIVGEAPRRRRRRVCHCRCVCGNVVEVFHYNLVSGNTTSCGCAARANSRKHGKFGTPVYRAYRHMLERCLNRNDPSYPRYGGRGITVCARWRGPDGFINFLADMGEPTAKMTIERRDNSGPYSPDNCCWATRLQQANNTRNVVLLTYNGRSQSIAAWARELGVRSWTLTARRRLGWSDERILTTPIRACAR